MENLAPTSVIPQDRFASVLEPIQENLSVLSELLHRHQRANLPAMGEGTVDFVKEALIKAKLHPNNIPSRISIRDLEQKVELIERIEEALRPLEIMREKLAQAALLTASEVYVPCLGIHNALKLKEIKDASDKLTEIETLNY